MNKSSSNYRSAITGRFVTERYGKSHPNTTVKERVKSETSKKQTKR